MGKSIISFDRRAWRLGMVGIGALLLSGTWLCGSRALHAAPVEPVSAMAMPQNPQVSAIAPNKLSARAALALDRSVKDLYWVTAKEDYASIADLLAQDQGELTRGMHRRTLLEGDTSRKEIALTFDDGPHPQTTLRLLAILKQYGIKATFFVVGEKAEQRPDLIQAEATAGDSIGNHTYNHVSLVKIPQAYVGTEIKACGEVIHSITNQDPHLFRPPGGTYDPTVAETSESLGYTTVLWTDDPGDYASPGVDTIVSRTVDKATPGGIILLHDGTEQTLQALPQIISILRERGYQFVTIDQMLAEKAARHEANHDSAALAAWNSKE